MVEKREKNVIKYVIGGNEIVTLCQQFGETEREK
jgi:hypothetical protein